MKQRLTCLIPLYGSKRFESIVLKNIDEHLNAGMKVIVSDRHCKDSLIDKIDSLYKSNDALLTIKKTDEVDWVDNINKMIEMVDTDYFRILPHDDSTDGNSTQLLINALEKDKTAILATGVVLAKNLFGLRMPNFDELNKYEYENAGQWKLQDSLEFYWEKRFPGSFKGVVRSKPVQDNKLLIEKTPTLVHSERTWLFALTLLGKYIVVPDSILVKRYYRTSTHRQWTYSDKTTLNAAIVMADYSERLINDQCLLDEIKFNIFYNSLKQIRQQKKHSYYAGFRSKVKKLVPMFK